MRVYTLTEKDVRACGYDGVLDHSLRKLGKAVNSPKEADIVVIPIPLRDTTLPPALLKKIVEYCGVDERRLVAFDCSDFEPDYSDVAPNCLFIRCNTKGWMKKRMPRTISWPWPVEDLKECIPIPEGGHKYKIGFQGWIASSNVRYNSVHSIEREFGAEADVRAYQDFFGYLPEGSPEQTRRKSEFRRSLSECLLQLTPCSIHHVFPYRFFEAMSAGRVPVLFCTDHVYPFADKIDWKSCVVEFRADESQDAGRLIKTWLNEHNTAEIIEMGKKGREYYEKWLHRDKWDDLFKLAIEEQMIKDGLVCQERK